MKTLKVPDGKGPETKVNISLSGDLNDYEVGDFAKSSGASAQSTDPKLISHLDAQKQHDEITQKLVEHGAKGAVQAGLQQQQAQHDQQAQAQQSQQQMQQGVQDHNSQMIQQADAQANQPTAKG